MRCWIGHVQHVRIWIWIYCNVSSENKVILYSKYGSVYGMLSMKKAWLSEVFRTNANLFWKPHRAMFPSSLTKSDHSLYIHEREGETKGKRSTQGWGWLAKWSRRVSVKRSRSPPLPSQVFQFSLAPSFLTNRVFNDRIKIREKYRAVNSLNSQSRLRYTQVDIKSCSESLGPM